MATYAINSSFQISALALPWLGSTGFSALFAPFAASKSSNAPKIVNCFSSFLRCDNVFFSLRLSIRAQTSPRAQMQDHWTELHSNYIIYICNRKIWTFSLSRNFRFTYYLIDRPNLCPALFSNWMLCLTLWRCGLSVGTFNLIVYCY